MFNNAKPGVGPIADAAPSVHHPTLLIDHAVSTLPTSVPPVWATPIADPLPHVLWPGGAPGGPQHVAPQPPSTTTPEQPYSPVTPIDIFPVVGHPGTSDPNGGHLANGNFTPDPAPTSASSSSASSTTPTDPTQALLQLLLSGGASAGGLGPQNSIDPNAGNIAAIQPVPAQTSSSGNPVLIVVVLVVVAIGGFYWWAHRKQKKLGA